MKRALFLFAAVLAFLALPTHAQATSHEADLTYVDASCTSAQTCILQVYRAKCASATSCPSFTLSPISFTALPTANVSGVTQVSSAVTATNTTWSYIDTDPALQDSTTYVWVATAAFTALPSAASGPSTPFQGTTLGPPQTPSSSGTIKR